MHPLAIFLPRSLTSLLFSALIIQPELAGSSEASLVEAGQQTYLDHCAQCHGKDPQVVSYADLRGIAKSELVYVISGAGQMPTIDLTQAEIDALYGYLNTLSR